MLISSSKELSLGPYIPVKALRFWSSVVKSMEMALINPHRWIRRFSPCTSEHHQFAKRRHFLFVELSHALHRRGRHDDFDSLIRLFCLTRGGAGRFGYFAPLFRTSTRSIGPREATYSSRSSILRVICRARCVRTETYTTLPSSIAPKAPARIRLTAKQPVATSLAAVYPCHLQQAPPLPCASDNSISSGTSAGATRAALSAELRVADGALINFEHEPQINVGIDLADAGAGLSSRISIIVSVGDQKRPADARGAAMAGDPRGFGQRHGGGVVLARQDMPDVDAAGSELQFGGRKTRATCRRARVSSTMTAWPMSRVSLRCAGGGR